MVYHEGNSQDTELQKEAEEFIEEYRKIPLGMRPEAGALLGSFMDNLRMGADSRFSCSKASLKEESSNCKEGSISGNED